MTMSRGLINNRCVRTKRAYATSHANVGIYKNLTGKICIFPRKLNHVYKRFGDGKVATQTWGGELKQIIDPLHH